MKSVIFAGILFPSFAFASANLNNHLSLGVGTQYGGLLGIKYSTTYGTDTFYIGGGLADNLDEEYGITLGWERSLNPKHSLGLLVRTKELDWEHYIYENSNLLSASPNNKSLSEFKYKGRYESYIAGSYTYFFNRYDEASLLGGISLGKSYLKTNKDGSFRDGTELKLHFGYQF
ncbi:hypothetical protein [Microbulbifer sp. TRSA005]|jgi:hypothetical protein|uniref:hypothetical protein n=1 Tax=Microbulbifer sp. TRSA005 TaxID=3243383 RepID=UPI0040397FE3